MKLQAEYYQIEWCDLCIELQAKITRQKNEKWDENSMI